MRPGRAPGVGVFHNVKERGAWGANRLVRGRAPVESAGRGPGDKRIVTGRRGAGISGVAVVSEPQGLTPLLNVNGGGAMVSDPQGLTPVDTTIETAKVGIANPA